MFCVKLYTVSPPLPLAPPIAGISLASKRAISFNPALFFSSGITASTTDGTTTRAALYDGHKLIREAKAICSKDDTFDFGTGAKIAFERLTAKPAEPKKDLKPLNTKIFVLDGDGAFETSHIYEIKDGKIIDNEGWRYPFEGTLYNMNDVVNYLKPLNRRSGEEKYDSNGKELSEYSSKKQITVMEVKEG